MKDIKDDPGNKPDDKEKGPKYILDIENRLVPWDEETITTEQIIELGGWEANQGVILIDKDNNERTLQPSEIIELKPGMGFSKKVRFKRGDSTSRLDQELALLVKRFPNLQHKEKDGMQWYMLPDHALPDGWNRKTTNVAFHAQAGHPGAPPYGIYVLRGLTYNDKTPENFTDVASLQPPFPGDWSVLSWAPDDGEWKPTADIQLGSNLLNWALSFKHRFEGAA